MPKDQRLLMLKTVSRLCSVWTYRHLQSTSFYDWLLTDRDPGEILISYTNQKSALVDGDIYRYWWVHILIPTVRKHAPDGKPIALLLDNYSGHDSECIGPLGQVARTRSKRYTHGTGFIILKSAYFIIFISVIILLCSQLHIRCAAIRSGNYFCF